MIVQGYQVQYGNRALGLVEKGSTARVDGLEL